MPLLAAYVAMVVFSVLGLTQLWRLRKRKKLAGSAAQTRPVLPAKSEEQPVAREPIKRSAVCTNEQMRQILESDPLIAQILLRRSGFAHLRPDDVFDDQEALLRVIQQVPELTFQILHVAATQKEVVIDCRPITVKNRTFFPAEPEPGCYRDPSQFSHILLEDVALDDDEFYARLVTHELRVFEQFEVQGSHKVLYLLLDVSPSMKENVVGRSYARHIWARGVAIKQIVQALRGEATYFMRYFADSPGRLHRAITEVQAQQVIDSLFEVDFSQDGTSIQLALETAASDIKEREPDCAQAEILLLSDGESSLNLDSLQKAFGAKIRLHTVLIGDKESHDLKKISASYLKL